LSNGYQIAPERLSILVQDNEIHVIEGVIDNVPNDPRVFVDMYQLGNFKGIAAKTGDSFHCPESCRAVTSKNVQK
jgi:hypothetical protein